MCDIDENTVKMYVKASDPRSFVTSVFSTRSIALGSKKDYPSSSKMTELPFSLLHRPTTNSPLNFMYLPYRASCLVVYKLVYTYIQGILFSVWCTFAAQAVTFVARSKRK